MAPFENDNKNGALETSDSEERVPLKQRLRKMVASRGLTFESDAEWDIVVKAFTPKLDDAVTEKRENKLPDSPEMAQIENDNENSAIETSDSEERVPLKQRLRKMVASRGLIFESDAEWDNVVKAFAPKLDDAVTEKKENKLSDSPEMAQFENDNENSVIEASNSEERVPLKQRLRKMVASRGLIFESDVEWDNVVKAFTPKLDDAVTEKRENKLPDSPEMAQIENDNENSAIETSDSEERVPLKQRLRKMVANRGLIFESDAEWDNVVKAFTPKLDDSVTEKRENKLPDSPDMAQFENDNENSAIEASDSEERVPLKQRLRKMVASRGLIFESDTEWDNVVKAFTPKLDDAVTEKRDNKLPDSPEMAQFENDNENSAIETLESEERVPLKQRLRKMVASRGLIFESDAEWDKVVKAFTPKLDDAVTEKRENKLPDSPEMAQFENGNENSAIETLESEERVPLKQRLRKMAASRGLIFESDAEWDNVVKAFTPKLDDTVTEKSENKLPDSQEMAQFENGNENSAIETLDSEERVPLKQRLRKMVASRGLIFESDAEWDNVVKAFTPKLDDAVTEKRENKLPDSPHLYSGCSAEEWMIETVSREERHADKQGKCNHQESLTQKFENSSQTIAVACTSERGHSVDELDNVVLKERLMRILSSKSLKLKAAAKEENYPGASLPISESSLHQTAGTGKGELTYCDQKLPVPGDLWEIPRNDGIHSSEKNCSKSESNCGNAFLSGDIRAARGSTMLNIENIKAEPPICYECESFNLSTADQISFRNLVPIKKEIEIPGDSYEDELDHMLLRERMKLLSPKNVPRINISQSSECLSKIGPSALGWNPIASEPTQSPKVNSPRKRRKTVTDSIETALEEDAPGLLRALIENGVSVNEMKLYGESENNDALDDSSTKDNFAELKAVITKLFTRRDSLLKLGPFRCAKGEKASYCLACLFSLVEQARYLQFRNWPVEWGWCRDLQSFIFVFERHNRIVLERPEYGYATYFFQLEDSLTIDWQIKRLITAMKLTSCSRITLIENKALMLGDDLTEGEARVLMEYGWIPNTGLGTMLNYYDRVVHDRKNEKYSSEWRSKIGKLLMDGYNGGTIICTGIPRKVVDYNAAHPLEIKLELN